MNKVPKCLLLMPLMFFHSVEIRAQPGSGCNNSSLNGTYFYMLAGSLAINGQVAPYAELGKLIADGKGSVVGQSKASTSGSLASYTLNGTYSVQSNCAGTLTLIVNSSKTPESLTFQIVDGGISAVVAFSSSGGVIVGRAYRASGQCGTGSLAGSFGYLLSGVTSYAGSSYMYSDAGQVVSTGQGQMTVASVANIGSGATQTSGTGSYFIVNDCSGTAQVTNQNGIANYDIAVVAGGNVLFLETDSGTTVSGTAQPQAVRLVLPQFVFGGGWYTALYFTNTNQNAVSFTMNFSSDAGTPLTVPSLGGSSINVTLGAGGTTRIEAPNVGSLNEGYVSANLPVGVTGYGVFRQTIPGQVDQEAVVPFSDASSTVSTFAFDETAFTTGVAIVNPSAFPIVVTVTLTDTNGAAIGTSSVSLSPYSKTESSLRSIPGLAGMVSKLGRAQFSVLTGNVAVLGLRFGATAFTSIPAAQQ